MAACVSSVSSSFYTHHFHSSSWGMRRPCSSIFTFKIRKPSLICYSSNKKIGFLDQILDYIEGGPKLRKWYGAGDTISKSEMSDEEESEASETEAKDAVLVTDGDSEIGQMVILSLIVKRLRVKALVKNKQAAAEAFGTYVESMAGEVSNKLFLTKALRGVSAIICPTEGFLSSVGDLSGVQHVILLSQLPAYKGLSGIQALTKSKAREMAEQDEAIIMASRIPYTIIQVGLLENTPSRKRGFNFQEGIAMRGRLSMEDAASICVEALTVIPQRGFVFEVANGEENVSEWKQHLTALMEKAEQQL